MSVHDSNSAPGPFWPAAVATAPDFCYISPAFSAAFSHQETHDVSYGPAGLGLRIKYAHAPQRFRGVPLVEKRVSGTGEWRINPGIPQPGSL